MRLWAWTLAVYERPGVPQACLTLQDEYGLSTAFLLWAVWAKRADSQSLATGASLAKSWETSVLIPTRGVRRWLKTTLPSMDDLAREALRNQVKSMELDAERLLMESLEHLTSPVSEHHTLLACLRAAAKAWGVHNADNALQGLADAMD